MTALQNRVLALLEEGTKFECRTDETDGFTVLNYYKPGVVNPAITKYWQYFRGDGSEIYNTAPVAMI